jgi:hypothetical protein
MTSLTACRGCTQNRTGCVVAFAVMFAAELTVDNLGLELIGLVNHVNTFGAPVIGCLAL